MRRRHRTNGRRRSAGCPILPCAKCATGCQLKQFGARGQWRAAAGGRSISTSSKRPERAPLLRALDLLCHRRLGPSAKAHHNLADQPDDGRSRCDLPSGRRHVPDRLLPQLYEAGDRRLLPGSLDLARWDAVRSGGQGDHALDHDAVRLGALSEPHPHGDGDQSRGLPPWARSSRSTRSETTSASISSGPASSSAT